MTHKEYTRLKLGKSQEAIVYRLLMEANGAWVPEPTIRRIARLSQVNKIMGPLRNKGVTVEFNKNYRPGMGQYRIRRTA